MVKSRTLRCVRTSEADFVSGRVSVVLCLPIYGNKCNNDSIINDQQLLAHIRVISSRGSQWDIVQ
jgi:hypothetical protein